MRRRVMIPRADWRETATAAGFRFHTIDGAPYWVEDGCYEFGLRQIEEDLERPTAELMAMCREVVARAARDDEILSSLAIPVPYWDMVRSSWLRHDKDVYARFDLAYDGYGPAKMLELNADTPTALYEASFFQWLWLEQMRARGGVPADSDQFNSLHEALVAGFASLDRGYGLEAGPFLGGRTLYLTGCLESPEDQGTLQYLEDCARQAGLRTQMIAIEAIGVEEGSGRFVDLENQPISVLFKLYPWEFLVREPFGVYLRGPHAPQILEPAWKMVLSNKGLLVWLWRMFPGHPNLLPATFAADDTAWAANVRAIIGSHYVEKPLLSREGANVRLVNSAHPEQNLAITGPYGAEGMVVQRYHPLPMFINARGAACHAVVGSWYIAGRACGIGLREDDGPITVNTSRFVPHYFR